MTILSNLPTKKGKSKIRVGRGNASRGTYSGRGQKGQRSRSGGKGGLKRLGTRDWMLKIPKSKGFKSPHPKPEIIDLKYLASKFKSDVVITPGLAKKEGCVTNISAGVKILGKGPIKTKLRVKGFSLSASAKAAIEKAGGEVIIKPKNSEVKKVKDKKTVK